MDEINNEVIKVIPEEIQMDTGLDLSNVVKNSLIVVATVAVWEAGKWVVNKVRKVKQEADVAEEATDESVE